MNRIRDRAQAEATSLGLRIVDVRLKHTNLPTQNLEPTFARMRAEREREAADEIARGNEAAQRVRALADRTVVETLSESEREANITRGEADAEANRIFAEAYGADPEFFDFYRSLQAYEAALQGREFDHGDDADERFLPLSLFIGRKPVAGHRAGTSSGAGALMSVALLALGLVLIVEGLVYALAPSLVEDLLAAMRAMTIEQRRLMGLVAIALGLCLVVAAKDLGAI
jgi:membrane protease subunit HflC